MSEEFGGKDEANDALPKLPLPDIKRTLDVYINAIEAIVTPEKLQITRNNVEKFANNQDMLDEIDNLLKKRSQEKDNWAYEFWLDDMYMNNPVPLPINSSPGWVFPHQNFGSREHFCVYLARLAHGLLVYKRRIESGPLPPETVATKDGGKQTLCMEQYYRVFTTYRYPGEEMDRQVVTSGREEREKESIVVLSKSRLFEVTVKTGDEWIDLTTLANVFSAIQADTENDHLPLGDRVTLMTSSGRRRWAQHREAVAADVVNLDSLKAVESCLFLVCMDSLQQNRSDSARSQKSMLRQMLDGQGPFVNGSNRWFDKTIQIVCSMDGVSGLCYEHSVAEGIAVVAIIQDVLNEIRNNPMEDVLVKVSDVDFQDQSNILGKVETSVVGGSKFGVRELRFRITDELRGRIGEAIDDLKSMSDDVDLEVFKFEGFGKNFMKTSRCSPDAFAQMTLQLAYFRLHGRLCFTYESASTRRFRQGRVDNIRSSHPEALAFVKAMTMGRDKEGLELGKAKTLQLFKAAVAKQTQVMVDNITGQGLDIPMLGIREACKMLRPDERTDLFEDEVYKSSNLFQLSTSQVPISLPNSYMGYGAVVPDGYGVSYNLQEDHIIFCIGSFYSTHETSSIRMAESIEKSLIDINKLLTN